MANTVSLSRAVCRSSTMKCPRCGMGHLFDRFLKVAGGCDVCGEDFKPQRADDFPAYLVIVAVGHVVVPALLWVEMTYAPPAWLQLAIWLTVTLFGALALLQPTKGAIVGLQWQTGIMILHRHGREHASVPRHLRTVSSARRQAAPEWRIEERRRAPVFNFSSSNTSLAPSGGSGEQTNGKNPGGALANRQFGAGLDLHGRAPWGASCPSTVSALVRARTAPKAI